MRVAPPKRISCPPSPRRIAGAALGSRRSGARRGWRAGPALAGLALLAAPAVAVAGGFDIPDIGSRAVGRGGSYVVGVSDPTAIYYNPAALSKLRGTQLTYNHNFLFHDTRFQRQTLSDIWGPDAGTTFPEATNKEKVFLPGGFVAVSTDFGLENWTFALGAFGPPAIGKNNYPAYGPQSYQLTTMDIILVYYSASVSWKYKDWFGLGVTGQYVDMPRMDYGLVTDAVVTTDAPSSPVPAQGGTQLTATLRLKDRTSGTALVGMWARPHRRVELALAGRVIPVFLNPKGSVDVDRPELNADNVTADLAFQLPIKVRGGLRYIHPDPKAPERDLFDVELGAYWENWSTYKALQPQLSGQISGLDLQPLDLRKEWKDTVSVRLGGDFNLLPALGRHSNAEHPVSLTVRAGTFYESGAVNPNYANLDFPSFDRLGVGGGASLGWHGVYLTAGYMHIFQEKQVVSETFAKQFQQRPLRPCPDLCDGFSGVPANAGTFTSRFDVLSVGVDVRFRELLGNRRKKKGERRSEGAGNGDDAVKPSTPPVP